MYGEDGYSIDASHNNTQNDEIKKIPLNVYSVKWQKRDLPHVHILLYGWRIEYKL